MPCNDLPNRSSSFTSLLNTSAAVSLNLIGSAPPSLTQVLYSIRGYNCSFFPQNSTRFTGTSPQLQLMISCGSPAQVPGYNCFSFCGSLFPISTHTVVSLGSSLLTSMLQQKAHPGATPFPRLNSRSSVKPFSVSLSLLGSLSSRASFGPFIRRFEPLSALSVHSLSSLTLPLESPRSHGSGQRVTTSTFSVLPSP